MEVRISRNFAATDIDMSNVDHCIAVYEDRVFGWFIDEARKILKNSDHAAMIVLQPCFSYMEGHAILYRGEASEPIKSGPGKKFEPGKSKAFFRSAFHAIFPLDCEDQALKDQAANMLYDNLRCGLAHMGIMKPNVQLRPSPEGHAVRFGHDRGQVQVVEVDPTPFLAAIEAHARGYIERLHDPAQKDLRKRFERGWQIMHS